jgi:enoyl-CoA hydratase
MVGQDRLESFIARCERLKIDLDDGLLLVEIDHAERHNAVDDLLHEEFIELWSVADMTSDVRAVHITGAGTTFCVGGDIDMIVDSVGNFAAIETMQRHASQMTRGIVDCSKPIVTSINGAAAGAGLALALLADISVIAEDAIITDGHTQLGLVAGDHAALLWPLLCGLNRAKYLLLLSERITGAQAAEIGLVALAVPVGELAQTSLAIGRRLVSGSPAALRWTKHALNHWLRSNWSVFDASLAYEMLSFFGPDAAEGVAAFAAKRPPDFRREP